MVEQSNMFAIYPKSDCRHLQTSEIQKFGQYVFLSKQVVLADLPCKECQNIGENWICLSCHAVYCSRYVKEHMSLHYQQSTEHCVCLSFSDLSYWCYQCDSYITSPLLVAIRKNFEKNKFLTQLKEQFERAAPLEESSNQEDQKQPTLKEQNGQPIENMNQNTLIQKTDTTQSDKSPFISQSDEKDGPQESSQHKEEEKDQESNNLKEDSKNNQKESSQNKEEAKDQQQNTLKEEDQKKEQQTVKKESIEGQKKEPKTVDVKTEEQKTEEQKTEEQKTGKSIIQKQEETKQNTTHVSSKLKSTKVSNYNDLVRGLKEKNFKKIAVLTGAGISVASGIPDFRTPGTGLYSKLQKYKLDYPEQIFTLSYFVGKPEPFYQLAKEWIGADYQPVLAHHFIKKLETENVLNINYTQNIDDLELKANLSQEKLVQAHGTFRTAACSICKKKQDIEEFKKQCQSDQIMKCICGGIIKPEIVFFGENLPPIFWEKLSLIKNCDLAIIMGSSMLVSPFSYLVQFIKESVSIVLINREQSVLSDQVLFLQGDIENTLTKLYSDVGWELPKINYPEKN